MKPLLCIVLLFAVTGCRKYLSVVPKGEIIPTQTSDYRLLLNQVDPIGSSVGFVGCYSEDVLLTDDMQVTPFSTNFYSADDQNALSFAANIYQDFEEDPDWDALYNQIYVTNLVISQVLTSQGGTEADKNELMAEARVHRAFAFFTLVNLYAGQYVRQTADTALGIPLRTGLDFQESLKRASVQEVYDFVLNDLRLSVGSLPAAPQLNYTYRPVQAAAYALLARTHLFMNEIDSALAYADSSLADYNVLLDYNQLPPSVIIPGGLQYPIGLQNPEITLYKSTVSSTSLFYADSLLMDLYDPRNDLRVSTQYFNDALFGLNYGYISTQWSGRTPVKGMTVAEAYLMRAECYARKGDVTDAMADLNELRSHRYVTGSSYALSASTPAEALVLVKAERRRELAFQGLRLFDIKRYNTYDNDNITVTHVFNGQTYALAPGSPRYVLPIGRKYITQNPEIVQNPR